MTTQRATTQRMIDALSSPVRRDILWMVWDRELAVGDIVAAFDLSAATISVHLSMLRVAGLVTMRSDGNFRRYRADQKALSGVRGLLRPEGRKWTPGTSSEPLALGRAMAVVVVETDAPCDRETAFRAFTNADVYSHWAGATVTLTDGYFTAETERGLRVRGTYDHVVAPALIVMSWDFEAGQVPVPGAAHRAYLEFFESGPRCHLVLHQLVRSQDQARYMERAWGIMLARFRDSVVHSGIAGAVELPAAVRAKRRRQQAASS